MKSCIIVILGASILSTVNLMAQTALDDFSLNNTNTSTNTTITVLVHDLTARIDQINNNIKNIHPRCYITLALLSCIIIPTIIFLGKILYMYSYKKLLLKPSNYEVTTHPLS